MNTLNGRILISHAIFICILITIFFLTLFYLQKGTAIRNLQSGIFLTNSKMLSLINSDLIIRNDDVKKPQFYESGSYLKIAQRDKKYIAVLNELKEFDHVDVVKDFGISAGLERVERDIAAYNRLHQRLLALRKIMGFRDNGLEGEMRGYAHALENYPSGVDPSELLTLRRHEKDYILRKDSIYVIALNDLAERLKDKLIKQSHSESNQELFTLVSSYQQTFNEIVKTEAVIGNESEGLIRDVNRAISAVTLSFEQLSDEVNMRTKVLIDRLIKSFFVVMLIGVLISLILGHFSASFVTRSVRNLAKSIQTAQENGLVVPEWRPSKYATSETKSLFNSYTKLLETIRIQLAELEGQTRQLTLQNEELFKINKLLEMSQKSLEESNQVKDKFFSIIGHDLRGPMGNLTMSLKILAEGMDTMSRQEVGTFCQNIMASADAISVLLDNLLVWARTQTDSLIPKMENVKLHDIVEKIKSLQAQRLQDKSINFINEIDVDTVLSIDRNMIDLVLRNLLDNAIKFTRNEGYIKVATEIKDGFINILVIDNGIGITQEAQMTLFTSLVKKQSQGTKGEKGTGLGLMLAYDFVRKHNGLLDVRSRPNEGSTFIVSLPVKRVVSIGTKEIV